MTTPNNPARSFKSVIEILEAALADYPACGNSGVLTVWATYSVALDWMAEDDGDSTTEFNENFWVCTLPLGTPSVNASREAIFPLKFEYCYGHSNLEANPYAPDSIYE